LFCYHNNSTHVFGVKDCMHTLLLPNFRSRVGRDNYSVRHLVWPPAARLSPTTVRQFAKVIWPPVDQTFLLICFPLFDGSLGFGLHQTAPSVKLPGWAGLQRWVCCSTPGCWKMSKSSGGCRTEGTFQRVSCRHIHAQTHWYPIIYIYIYKHMFIFEYIYIICTCIHTHYSDYTHSMRT
jgi:hypothetical protein